MTNRPSRGRPRGTWRGSQTSASPARPARRFPGSRNIPFDVVLTDLHMRGRDGLALLRIVHDRWPAMRRVLMSGTRLMNDERRALAHAYLIKPPRVVGATRHAPRSRSSENPAYGAPLRTLSENPLASGAEPARRSSARQFCAPLKISSDKSVRVLPHSALRGRPTRWTSPNGASTSHRHLPSRRL